MVSAVADTNAPGNPIFAMKFNYSIERAIIVFICLWGNWAIYYWSMVLTIDASYSELKLYSPILLLQVLASLGFLIQLDLGITKVQNSRSQPYKAFAPLNGSNRFYMLSGALTVLAFGIVFAIGYSNLSKSFLPYNLFWVLLLPVFLSYIVHFNKPVIEFSQSVSNTTTNSQSLDIILLVIVTAALAINLYGLVAPTYDDAFYAHVISSTLANTELPVQGQDLLLNTSAPYTLHPAYSLVGYEVLIAFASDLFNLDPLYLYYTIFPTLNLIFWIFSAYTLLRSLGTPYPGFALTVCIGALLMWNTGFAPGGTLMFLNWGKNLVLLNVAPHSFLFVAVFLRNRSMKSWLLLLLCTASLGIMSSSAFYLVPVSIGLACLLYLKPTKANIRWLLLVLCSLTPYIFLFSYTVFTLQHAPSNTGGFNTGLISVQGEAFGGLYTKVLILVMLLILPIAARTVGNPAFQLNLYKISLIGTFTVMSPYLAETIAVLTGTKLLSWRLQYAFPTMLLVGILASIALTHLKPYLGTATHLRSRAGILVLSLVFYSAFFATMDKHILFGDWKRGLVVFEADFEEAKAARALIPDGAFVAAGDLDDILPIFPNPPSFIQSKFYLSFHKHFLSREDFARRDHLHRVLQNRLPRKGKTKEASLNWIVTTVRKLGVTTLVFHAVGGRQRLYIRTDKVAPRNPETDARRSEFISALVARLRQEKFACNTTPSAKTWVCNREN